MSDGERKTYAWLLNETKIELNRHRRKVIIASIVVSLVVLGIIIWYWNRPTVAYSMSLLIGEVICIVGSVTISIRCCVKSIDTRANEYDEMGWQL